jgi:hypothetical protein
LHRTAFGAVQVSNLSIFQTLNFIFIYEEIASSPEGLLAMT